MKSHRDNSGTSLARAPARAACLLQGFPPASSPGLARDDREMQTCVRETTRMDHYSCHSTMIHVCSLCQEGCHTSQVFPSLANNLWLMDQGHRFSLLHI